MVSERRMFLRYDVSALRVDQGVAGILRVMANAADQDNMVSSLVTSLHATLEQSQDPRKDR